MKVYDEMLVAMKAIAAHAYQSLDAKDTLAVENAIAALRIQAQIEGVAAVVAIMIMSCEIMERTAGAMKDPVSS